MLMWSQCSTLGCGKIFEKTTLDLPHLQGTTAARKSPAVARTYDTLRFVSTKVFLFQLDARVGDRAARGACTPVGTRAGLVQQPLDIHPQVPWRKGLQATDRLGELGPDTMSIAPLDMDEGTGVQDESMVELAPVLTPSVFECLVALPECCLIEEADECL
jgi:hypothetical protein